jgi:DNA invertase Pin-like site-specific DNA recombinase
MYVFAALAEYQRREILAKTAHGIRLAKEKGVHIGRRRGVNSVQLAKLRSCLDANIPVLKIVTTMGISLVIIKSYRTILTTETLQPNN